MHILSPEADNCPSWISGRERMTVENISWSISTKECCRPWRGLNPRPPGLQSDGASNWATKAGWWCRVVNSAEIAKNSFMLVLGSIAQNTYENEVYLVDSLPFFSWEQILSFLIGHLIKRKTKTFAPHSFPTTNPTSTHFVTDIRILLPTRIHFQSKNWKPLKF